MKAGKEKRKFIPPCKDAVPEQSLSESEDREAMAFTGIDESCKGNLNQT
jgi:hypothetical protein